MNRTLGISLLAMIVPAIALAIFVRLEGREKGSTDGVLEPTGGVDARTEFKPIPSRKLQLTTKTPIDVRLHVRQSTDTKTPRR